MYKILLTKEAIKNYKKCDTNDKKKIDKCFKELNKNPYISNNIKRLHGELKGLFRYRIGDMRIIYKIEENNVLVIVFSIASRGNVYK